MALMKPHKFIIFVVSFFALIPAFALEADRAAPIEIEADSVDINQAKGYAHYTGNVRMTQGSIKIIAHSIRARAKNGALHSAEISGSSPLASFEQTLENGQIMRATAENIDVKQGAGDIVFTGNATVNDGQNTISGAQIRYNSQQQHIVAEKGKNDNERVKMIFLPPSNTTP